jgi:E3 ubiquitin-protein ligase Topors
MKSLDIRSESAVKLLSEFLDMDKSYVEGDPHPNAEHFAHGMLSFLLVPWLLFTVLIFP